MTIAAVLAAASCATATPEKTATADEQPKRSSFTYVHRAGGDLILHVFSPIRAETGPAPAVLLFHGGGWEVGQPEWVFWNAEQFARQGIASIAVQYRLFSSDDPDRRNTIVSSVEDACAAFRWVRTNSARLNVDPKRIAGFGVSAGGHLAAMAGTGACGPDGRADALVLLSAALDPRDQDYYPRKMPRGADDALLDAYSPIDRLRNGASLPPTLVINGDRDIQTPHESAEALCALAHAHGAICRLQIYPALGHLLTADLEAQRRDEYPPNFSANQDAQRRSELFLKELGF